ncbi:O-antigen ligase family protein [Geothrix limicola]|nr:O-antigen ligase family protein [Geothrix limicola]
MQIIPLGPVVLLISLVGLHLCRWTLPSWLQMRNLYLVIGLLILETLVRPGSFSLASLVGRCGNYFAAMVVLQVYAGTASGTLQRDLRVLLVPMAWQALLTVLLAHTLGFLFIPITIGEQNYLTFLGIFNYHITIEGLSGLIRPDGFFYEPGVYQIYLNLLLYLALFRFRQNRLAILASVSVLLTQSTTGILICLLQFAFIGVRLISQGSIRRRMVVLAALLVAGPPMVFFAYANVMEKLFGAAQGSSWSREYDLYTGLRIAMEHPWMGIGFETSRYLEASGRLGFEGTLLDANKLLDRPSSNGLVQILYALGIPLSLPFLIGFFRQKVLPHRFLIGCWLVLSLFGEALVVTPFFTFILFSAFLIGEKQTGTGNQTSLLEARP